MEDTAFSMACFGRWIHAFSILLRSGERKQLFSFCRNRVGPEFLITPPLYVENFSIIVPKTKSRHTMRKCTIYWLISF